MSVYLDHNATTPIDDRVLAAMLPYLKGSYGNPSSRHRLGRESQLALQRAREQVATLVGVTPAQVVFTSGGTEANNLALKGMMAAADAGATVMVSAVEHPSVLQAAYALRSVGHPLAVIDVDENGVVDVAAFEQTLIESRASLVSVMLANNETGAVQDIAPMSKVAKRCGAAMHTDAVQALGKIAVDFTSLGVAAMSLSAHKIYGPKGVGALIVEKGLALQPLLQGGGHETGLRAGTENVAAIVGFGAAAELVLSGLEQQSGHLRCLRQHAEKALLTIPEVTIFSQHVERLPNTIFFAVKGIEGATLLMNLDRDGIAVSSGSACGTSDGEPSHVLRSMGVDIELAHGAVRISFGQGNTIEEVDQLMISLQREIENLLKLNSAWA